jgi:hypothetical protein
MVENLIVKDDLKNLTHFYGLSELIEVEVWIIISFDNLKDKIIFFEDSKRVFEISFKNSNKFLLRLYLRERRVNDLA